MMKYFALLALLLLAVQPAPTAYGQPDSGKTKMIGKAGAVRDGDSCNECRHMRGGPMMGHDGMMCREGGMMMGGREGMEGCMRGHGPMRCGMMHGGIVRMIFRGIFGLLLLTALVLLIMMEIHWVRLLSLRVKAAKLIDAGPKA